MKLTYIVTVNPVIPLKYLNMLVHSLNLQTSKDFDVVFYNQTRLPHDTMIKSLAIRPDFEYSFFDVPEEHFFGQYPVWDLFGAHQSLLEQGRLGDYFMSLHMEEFLNPTYTECASRVLSKTGLDILLGNLHATPFVYEDVAGMLNTTSAESFSTEISQHGIDSAIKWGMTAKPFFVTRSLSTAIKRAQVLSMLRWKKQLRPTSDGFTLLGEYMLEDIFFMSTKFALNSSWYACEPHLYFEDIHINSALAGILNQVTTFPAYLNTSKAYHLEHGRYYYQLEDAEFARGFLAFHTENEALQTLKEAIRLYRDGNGLAVNEALRLSRKNTVTRGVSDISVDYHTKMIMRMIDDEKKTPGTSRAV